MAEGAEAIQRGGREDRKDFVLFSVLFADSAFDPSSAISACSALSLVRGESRTGTLQLFSRRDG
jgi:hypothetical protein